MLLLRHGDVKTAIAKRKRYVRMERRLDGPAAWLVHVVGEVSAENFGVLMRIDPAKRENEVGARLKVDNHQAAIG